MRQVCIAVQACLFMFLAGCSSSGTTTAPAPGSNIATGFVYDKLEGFGDRQFAVFLPGNYNPQTKYPAIVFLHGRFEAGSDGRAATSVGIGPEARKNARNFPFIVVFPQCNGGGWNNAEHEKIAITALEQAKRKYSIDPNRVILTGLSTGGYGTWRIGAKYRDQFAALVPLCGYSFYEGVSMLTGTPIWCWHYAADWAVSSGASKEMVKRINAAGGSAKITTPGGLGHNVWTIAYKDPALMQWMLQQRRK